MSYFDKNGLGFMYLLWAIFSQIHLFMWSWLNHDFHVSWKKGKFTTYGKAYGNVGMVTDTNRGSWCRIPSPTTAKCTFYRLKILLFSQVDKLNEFFNIGELFTFSSFFTYINTAKVLLILDHFFLQ
jgi:hypothetical protein